MNNSKKFIIALIVIIITIILCVVVVKINKVPKDDWTDDEDRESLIEKKEATKGKIQPVDSISDFELARICLQKFYIKLLFYHP